jgi:hypothetical protein
MKIKNSRTKANEIFFKPPKRKSTLKGEVLDLFKTIKKKGICLLLIAIIMVLSSFSFILAENFTLDNNLIKQCKKECTLNNNMELEKCKTSYQDCINNCPKISKICKKECNNNKSNCNFIIKFVFSNCNNECKFKITNLNTTCENSKYNSSDVFLKDNEICRCRYDGKIKCKKNPFFSASFYIDKEKCINSNGLFQQLCNGPYFDIYCSKEFYCLCNGNNNYSCPDNYECLEKIPKGLLLKRTNTISGYKTLLGLDLGNIGICIKKTTD